MHKITKGLKKKKKGKKSKRKEEELFKPEELEAYRREHNQQNQNAEDAQETAENEEWKKFNALTSGIDDILKKTQGDLDRIKSTSFFQRVPVQSELKKKEAELQQQQQQEQLLESKQTEPETAPSVSAVEAAIVPVSESESDYEDEDDIFDTTYIDAVTSGEIKLAYIPESPTDDQGGDDPFDTRIAERAILGPETVRKGTKLVPIGAAVEILTGRVQAPTCVRKPTSNREIFKEKDLLLGSFDDEGVVGNRGSNESRQLDSPKTNSTLLDDDAPATLANEPIDLSKSLHLEALIIQENTRQETVIAQIDDEDEDDEFARLAAESLSKLSTVPTVVSSNSQFISEVCVETENWSAFDLGEKQKLNSEEEKDEINLEEDPFDTTFAENILPGKAELRVIESQILNAKEEEYTPKTNILTEIQQKIKIQLYDPSGQRESISSLDRVSESDLFCIKPIHRDLLGGSNTDLSQVGDTPLEPSESIDDNYIEYADPFDTSLVDSIKPGQTELKFLERELLGDIKNLSKSNDNQDDDDDFNPRAEETGQNYNQSRKVSFDLPLDVNQEDCKSVKPLTPYYVRENSISEVEEHEDPFDTSFVSNIGIGKVELKLIESELFKEDDQNFNPRDDKVSKVVETIRQVSEPSVNTLQEKSVPIDLLGIEEKDEVPVKVLTPSAESPSFDLEYSDPFDTSIASNIVPGKTELKLLEKELFNT